MPERIDARFVTVGPADANRVVADRFDIDRSEFLGPCRLHNRQTRPVKRVTHVATCGTRAPPAQQFDRQHVRHTIAPRDSQVLIPLELQLRRRGNHLSNVTRSGLELVGLSLFVPGNWPPVSSTNNDERRR